MDTLSFLENLPLRQISLFCFWFSITFYLYTRQSQVLHSNFPIKHHVKNMTYVKFLGLVGIFVFSFKCLILIFESCLSSFIDKIVISGYKTQVLNTQNLVAWIAENNVNSSYSLESLFNLTGNSGIDLLIIIQVFQRLELILIPFIAYNLLLHFISEEKMESILLKVLPVKFVTAYLKYFRIFKLQSIFIIILLLLLTFTFNYLAYYYLDFYLTNIDGIIEHCFKDYNQK